MSRKTPGILFRFLAVMLLALLPAAAMAADLTVTASAPFTRAKGAQEIPVTYRFTNPNAQGVTGMGLDINMSTIGREWRATGTLVENTCGGTFSVVAGSAISSDYDPSSIVRLRNGVIAANASCLLTYMVTPARKITASSQFSSSSNHALTAGLVVTDQGHTNVASGNLLLLYRIGMNTTTRIGGASTLAMDVFSREEADAVIWLNSYTALPLPGLDVPVNIPSAVEVLSSSTTCGTLAPRTGGMTWSLDMPAAPPEPTTPQWGSAECVATFRVRPKTAGTHTITVPNGRYQEYHVSSSVGRINATLSPLNAAVAFASPLVAQGATTTFQVDIVNSLAAGSANDRHGDSPSLTLALPAWLTPAGPASTTCPGASANASGSTLQMTGGVFAAGTSCRLSLPVSLSVTGSFSLAFPAGTLRTTEGASNPRDLAASLRVLAPPALSLSVAPPMTGVGRTGQATLHLENPNGSTLNPEGFTNVSFDILQPAGLDFSGGAPVSTCSGFAAAPGAGGRLVVTGIALAAASSCTFTLPATGTAAGLHTAQSGNMTAADIGAIASQPLSVPWRVVADPLLRIFALAAPEMEVPFRAAIELENLNPVAISMNGPGLVLPLPQAPGAMRLEGSVPTVSGCGAAVLSAPAGGATVSLSGGTLPAGGTCRVEVDLVTPEGGGHVFQPQGLVLQYGTVVLPPITLSVEGGPISLQVHRSIQVLDEQVDDLADCAALDDSAANGLHAVPGACLEIEISIANPASETRTAHAVEAREAISPHLALAAWDQGELDSLTQGSGLLVAAIAALPPGETRSFSYRAMVQ